MPVEGASDTALSFDIAGQTGGSLGSTGAAGASDDAPDDVLGGKRTFYPSGQLCSYFKKDGSGIVHYPDGRIAVNVVAGDGIPPGLFTTFFTRKGKKDVVGSWNAVGVGSCVYKNNKVMLNTTEVGGTYYDEFGNLVRMWTWDKKPLTEPISVALNDFIDLEVVNQKDIRATFHAGDKKVVFQMGKVMRRADSYLDKITGVGTGDERGKFTLDITKCREALAKTQVLRDSFKAAKVDPNMPKEGALDPRVIEMANNPSKVTTKAIRDQIAVIMTITTENAGNLHALSYIEHEIGEDGRRRPAKTVGPDPLSQSAKLQQQMAKGWKCVLPRADPDSAPTRAPVLMGGRFETCTRFSPYFTKKVKLTAIKSAEYDTFLAKVPKTQAVLIACISAAVPLASNRAVALLEDANGIVWERFGGMVDLKTRECTKSVNDLPYRIATFDIAEGRLLVQRHNIKLVYASNTFTSTFNQNHDFHHAEVERMFEAVNKKCFGYTVEDVLRKLEASRGDGQKGKFLQQDIKFGLPPSGLADAQVLAKIKPFPSATIANQKKKPLLKSVVSEPTAVDGISKRMNHVFGQSGKVS